MLSKLINFFKKNEEEVTYTQKWTPNIEIKKEFDALTRDVQRINQWKNKLSYAEQDKKRIENQYNEIENSQDIEHRVERVQLIEQIQNKDFEINELQNNIQNAKSKSTDVLDKWENYIKSASKFIIANNLVGVVKPTDILDYQGIYIKSKSLIDETIVSVNKNEAVKKIEIMNKYFDLKKSAELTKHTFERKYMEILNILDDDEMDNNRLLNYLPDIPKPLNEQTDVYLIPKPLNNVQPNETRKS